MILVRMHKMTKFGSNEMPILNKNAEEMSRGCPFGCFSHSLLKIKIGTSSTQLVFQHR